MEHAKDWAQASANGVAIRELTDRRWAESARVKSRPEHLNGEGDADAPIPSNLKSWPLLKGHARYGLVGDVAALATAHSEADPVAVMASLLVWVAAILGRTRHMIMAAVERILQRESSLPFPTGHKLKVSYGPLSSGEGLIHAIKDKVDGDEKDKGVIDKRLFCVESELGAALRAIERKGNNLSSVLRLAWDGLTLEPMIKNNPDRATDPHICLLAHITLQELIQLLSSTDIWNGFANRFLWFVVRRAQIVPFPKPMADEDIERIAKELVRVVKHAHSSSQPIVMSNSAAALWGEHYAELNIEHPGILGTGTTRSAPQALRLALTYAQLDGSNRIEDKHLEAAMTLWRYAFDSAAYIFGGKELDPVAQTILDALATGPKSQNEIRDLFARHMPAERLAQVLGDLQERGRITLKEEPTGGRPRRMWSLAL